MKPIKSFILKQVFIFICFPNFQRAGDYFRKMMLPHERLFGNPLSLQSGIF